MADPHAAAVSLDRLDPAVAADTAVDVADGLAAEPLALELGAARDLPAEFARAVHVQHVAQRLGRRDLYLRATLPGATC